MEFSKRRSIRLRHFDYTSEGVYFVTICTQDRRCLFGEIFNTAMHTNEFGRLVQHFWENLHSHYPCSQAEDFVVMPNHFHGIVRSLNKDSKVTLGQVIGYFKYQTTKEINGVLKTPYRRIWQRNYYEHIIRDYGDYQRIAAYIENNPMNWETDSHYMGGGSFG